MKKLYIILTVLCCAHIASAQRFDEIVKYSRISPDGSARTSAMGNAFGALGGDLSSMSTNPAGLGVFRKSEFSFTPLINLNTIKSDGLSEGKDKFLIGNMGVVFSIPNGRGNWRSFNIGVNYTNLNNFNKRSYQNINSSSTSMTDLWALDAGNRDSDDLDFYTDGLAYDTWLINRVEDPDDPMYGFYYSALDDPYTKVNQYKWLKEKGYHGEYAISFGTNYRDKLYLGLTIGLQSFYHKIQSEYAEETDKDSMEELDYYYFYENQKMVGTGTNFKFGAIYRPIPELRLGLAIHTPTWFDVSHDFGTSIYSEFRVPQQDNYNTFDAWSPLLQIDYNMRTPWRMIVSAAGVFLQKGIISFDYEYVDYGSARYTESADGYDYDRSYREGENPVNVDIKNYFKEGHNFRVGAEYRLNSIVSLRAGYAFQDSPYKEATYMVNYTIPGGEKTNSVSAGLGLNFGNFYCDASYVNKTSKDKTGFYYRYYSDLDEERIAPVIKNKYTDNQIRLTFGVRF